MMFQLSTFVKIGLVAITCVQALDVGGPKGSYDPTVLQRDYELHLRSHHTLHRRHHVKARGKAKRAKCSGSGTTTTSSSSSVSTSGSTANSTDSSSSSSNSSSSSSSDTTSASLSGITGFTSSNTGIGSWFRTDSSQDSTNGRSWCQLNYQDTWMGFAPDVSVMLSNFGGDTTSAGDAYCGLEAKATNPNNGNTALIYIVDGFDPKWVRTPGSIDLTLAAFKALYGSSTDDKDIVIQNLQWEFTGNKNTAYAFNAGS